MVKEFKEFILRGNVVDMAVGIIIGAALGAASMTLRILLGIERSWLGLQKGE